MSVQAMPASNTASIETAAQASWLPRFWDNDQLVVLRFASSEELDAAIDWLWTLPESRRPPRVHVGENAMAVPAQAASCFVKQGFEFTINPVISAGDLSAGEVNRLRAGASV